MSFCKLNGRSSGIDVNKRERDIYRDTSVVHGLFHSFVCVMTTSLYCVAFFSEYIFQESLP